MFRFFWGQSPARQNRSEILDETPGFWMRIFAEQSQWKKQVIYFTGVISHGTHFGGIKVDANVW